MKELIKESVYAGVGLAAVAVEKVQTYVEEINEELESKTQTYRDEGRKIVDKWTEEVESRRDDFLNTVATSKDKFVKGVEERVDEITGKVTDSVEELGDKVVEATTDIAEAVEIPSGEELAEKGEEVVAAVKKRTTRSRAVTKK